MSQTSANHPARHPAAPEAPPSRDRAEGAGASIDRRAFLRGVAGGASLLGLGAVPLAPIAPSAEAAQSIPAGDRRRRAEAMAVRFDAARLSRRRPDVVHVNNGEEDLYPSKIASYSKGLPHNELGEVDPAAYRALTRAITTGRDQDFEAIPLGLGRKLTDPMAGLAFDLEGADPSDMAMPPAPTIAGPEAAAELAELYWLALARDVHLLEYASDGTIAEAAADLSRFSAFSGPKQNGVVSPATIFRGATTGDLIGPYLSQFLWLDIPMGALLIPQRMHTTLPGVDYLTEHSEWLAVQNGFVPDPAPLDPTPRYIRNLRDLGEWVHMDALYQAYHQACLILLGMEAPFGSGIPYRSSRTQAGFGTFGGPHVLSLVTEVATRALKAVWFQKWFVHRRLRPEAFGGLVDNTITGRASYPIHPELLGSAALARIASSYGSSLLPVGAPEGCPTHPSYGAGHATVAGACVTMLKAWFDESAVIPAPVVPDASGTALVPYSGPPLTVGHELDKLASNVAIGRNAVGFHYRSDYAQSLRLGEAVATCVLQEQKLTYEQPATFTFTRFDGTLATI